MFSIAYVPINIPSINTNMRCGLLFLFLIYDEHAFEFAFFFLKREILISRFFCKKRLVVLTKNGDKNACIIATMYAKYSFIIINSTYC